jgi:hypothetical protein
MTSKINISLSKVGPGSEGQKPHTFSHMWHIDLILIQLYYEKQVTLKGGHIGEREGKRRKLRR